MRDIFMKTHKVNFSAILVDPSPPITNQFAFKVKLYPTVISRNKKSLSM